MKPPACQRFFSHFFHRSSRRAGTYPNGCRNYQMRTNLPPCHCEPSAHTGCGNLVQELLTAYKLVRLPFARSARPVVVPYEHGMHPHRRARTRKGMPIRNAPSPRTAALTPPVCRCRHRCNAGGKRNSERYAIPYRSPFTILLFTIPVPHLRGLQKCASRFQRYRSASHRRSKYPARSPRRSKHRCS